MDWGGGGGASRVLFLQETGKLGFHLHPWMGEELGRPEVRAQGFIPMEGKAEEKDKGVLATTGQWGTERHLFRHRFVQPESLLLLLCSGPQFLPPAGLQM